MKKANGRKLIYRIICYCVLFAAALGSCIGAVGYVTYKANMMERYHTYVSTLLDIASSSFDGDDLKLCIEEQKENDSSIRSRQLLNTMKERSKISYIYAVYFPDKNQPYTMNFIMNGTTRSELEGKKASQIVSALGEPCEDAFSPSMTKAFYDAFYEEPAGDDYRYIINKTEEYGYQMTGYLVLRDSSGAGVGILAVDLSVNQMKRVMMSYVLTVAASAMGILFLFLVLFIRALNRNIVTPVKLIALSTREFVSQTKGSEDPADLNYKNVLVHTGDEIQILSESLADMTSELKDYMGNLQKVTAEKERIGAELQVATQIQASMLPSIFPAFPEQEEFDIYAFMEPAKEVGGDFYDFFLVDSDHLAVVIADVSGKGVPAALFMVIAKTLIKNHAQAGKSPKEVFNIVNRQLCENNEAGLFVTAWMGILTMSTGEFCYSNAGHNPPLRKKVGGEFAYLKCAPGFVLAGMEGITYSQASMTLMPGDVLYLYTDGVTEATDCNDELYGEERLLLKLNQSAGRPLADILMDIKEDMDVFVKEAPQFDDITMMILEINPSKNLK